MEGLDCSLFFLFFLLTHGDWHLHFGNWVSLLISRFRFWFWFSRFGFFSVLFCCIFYIALRYSSVSLQRLLQGTQVGFFFYFGDLLCFICFDFWGICMYSAFRHGRTMGLCMKTYAFTNSYEVTKL